ncbi:MAG TPA: uroporphyrinogen-III synthase [Myxococcales bacterium]|jgi:uroporphyrinogen-III synthase
MSRPLEGKRVLVTRAAEDCAELEELLRERGAAPVRMPCIAFEDAPDAADVGRAMEKADLVVVSSPHAARRLRALCPDLARRPLAAVGDATAKELHAGADSAGRVRVPKSGGGAQALVEELGSSIQGKRVFVPRAERGTPALTAGLRAAGAVVQEFVLYKTIVPRSADPAIVRDLHAGFVHLITFLSGSAVRGFVQLVGAHSGVRGGVACLGASAREEAIAAGFRPVFCGRGEGLSELCDGLALAVTAGNA